MADSWTSTGTGISLTADAELSSTAAAGLATLETNGYDFKLGSDTTDLTLANVFTLATGTLSTQGADLIFAGSADISSGATLDATVLTGAGGKLEFQQGGTAAGTINASNAVFKIGSAYTVTGTLKTNSGTIWELGTADAPAYLDLSGGNIRASGKN